MRGGLAQNEVTLLPRARDALELTLAHQFVFIAEGAEAALQACLPERCPVVRP